MEKIYNNLNIENLTKTDWFNQFNHDQKLEILRGLEDNLDVSIYAKEEFDWEQMQEIRDGLKKTWMYLFMLKKNLMKIKCLKLK